jgi:hypothetical protein
VSDEEIEGLGGDRAAFAVKGRNGQIRVIGRGLLGSSPTFEVGALSETTLNSVWLDGREDAAKLGRQLLALAGAAGRLLPEGGEERTDWRVVYEYINGTRSTGIVFADEAAARHTTARPLGDVVVAIELSCRTVRTFPDGSEWIGVWREVTE